MKYEVLIGLEFHVQLKTATKMFCGCSNDDHGVPANTHICPICLGHPGTLPVINDQAIRMAMKAALGLHCRIAEFTKFDRKHYFYPDLAKGYQISQYDKPLAEEGYLDINFKAKDGLAARLDDEKQLKRVGIIRLHCEEDAAKNIHDKDGSTLVDFNRPGSPLVEIVTHPHMSTPQEAKTFAQELQLLMRYLEVSDADMEKGQLRCDANISLRPEGDNKLYPKTEIKNLNSFRSIERALHFEIKRQERLWEDGQAPEHQETRGWNEDTQETYSQRTKESQADYRYFPEPDLPPLTFTKKDIENVQTTLPELPQEKRYRFMAEFTFTPEATKLLTLNPSMADYTEKVLSELQEWISTLDGVDGTADEIWSKNKKKLCKMTANWLTNNLLTMMSDRKIVFADLKITAENFAEFITLVYESKVNSTNAQKILELMLENGGDPSLLMQEHNMEQVDDESALAEVVEKIIRENPDQVDEYKSGKEPIIKYLLGQVMRASKGKANPQKAEELLKKQLS